VLVEAVNQHIPAPWVALIQSKALYYRGLSHFHSAIAVLDQDDSDDVEKLREHFDDLHIWNPNRKFEQSVASKVPKSPEERKLFGKLSSVIIMKMVFKTSIEKLKWGF